MSAMKFIQVENHWIHIDAIGYVDFLDSGRAMVFIPGLHQEKQNISLDKAAAAHLRAYLESVMVPLEPPVNRR
jgi:hypothetical protein